MRNQLILLFVALLGLNCLLALAAPQAQQLNLNEKDIEALYDLSERVKHSNEEDRCARYDARLRELVSDEGLKRKPSYALLGKLINFLKVKATPNELREQILAHLIQCNRVNHKKSTTSGHVKPTHKLARKAGPRQATTTSSPDLPQDAVVQLASSNSDEPAGLSGANLSLLSKINYELKRVNLDDKAVCERYIGALRPMLPDVSDDLELLRETIELVRQRSNSKKYMFLEDLAKCERAASGESNNNQQQDNSQASEGRPSNYNQQQQQQNSVEGNENSSSENNYADQRRPEVQHEQNQSEFYSQSHQASENNGNGPVFASSASVSSNGKHVTTTMTSDGKRVVTTTSDGTTATTVEDNGSESQTENPEPSQAEEQEQERHHDDEEEHHKDKHVEHEIKKLEEEVEEVEEKNRELLKKLEENQERVEKIKRKLAALKPAPKPTLNQQNHFNNNGQISSASAIASAGNVFSSAGQLPAQNYHWSWSSNDGSSPPSNIPAFPKIEFPAFPTMPPMPAMPPMPTMFPQFH